MKKLFDDLGQIVPFTVLGKREIELLSDDAIEIVLTEKESLFQPGSPSDSLFIVMEGGIKLLNNNGGDRRLILEFFGPGELVVEEGLLKESAHNAEARPVGEASLLKISFKALRKLFDSNSRFVQAWLELLAGQLNGSRERLATMVFMDVESRLALALAQLCRKFGKRDEDGTLINAKVTHQDLSDYIAASRETVSLCLGQFRRKRLVQTRVRWLIVPDLKALKKFAAS
jgi:CRP/FNR family transcriptional regulator, cyclic AMP receptor protein